MKKSELEFIRRLSGLGIGIFSFEATRCLMDGSSWTIFAGVVIAMSLCCAVFYDVNDRLNDLNK